MSNNKRVISLYFSSLHKANDLCNLSLHKKYRTHFEIIALVLEAVMNNGATRFSISRHTGTSYKLLGKYLQVLTEIGFIEVCLKENRIIYKASRKGIDFLMQYYVLLEMLLSASANSRLKNAIYPACYDASAVKESHIAQTGNDI